MNKTININLAGIFFHIDEDAYHKLQYYLDAIKRSLKDSQGREEIIMDIEARIAELFTEKIKEQRQVISQKEVDEVIAVMGQPEDYLVDEEIFEDEPAPSGSRATLSKKLFRDTSSSYVGGVSSGLGHYSGTDAIWFRLLWVILTFISGGTFILIYIALWIFIPEAKTTADYLSMKGEPVTISNIEKKIKEGFSTISDKVKDVDYQKYNERIKNSSTTFFETVARIFSSFFKVISKFLGIFVLFISGITILTLTIGLIVFGIFGIVEAPFIDYIDAVNLPEIPIWLVSLLLFLFIAIPFIALFILGLKLLIPNRKTTGIVGKLSLLGVWLLSFITIIVISLTQVRKEAYTAEVIEEQVLNTTSSSDTLHIKMVKDSRYIEDLRHENSFTIRRDERNKKVLVFQDIRIGVVENKTDSLPRLIVKKIAKGKEYEKARNRASLIKFKTQQIGNELRLNGYMMSELASKVNDQKMEILLSIPEGMTLYTHPNATGYLRYWGPEGLSLDGKEQHYVRFQNGQLVCDSCSQNSWNYSDGDDDRDLSFQLKSNNGNDSSNIRIDEDGLELNSEDIKAKINEDGIEIKGDEMDIKINENGIKIDTKR